MTGHSPHSQPETHASAWTKHFDDEQRKTMLHDDSQTWRYVTMELIAIVTGGFLLMAFTVWLVLKLGVTS